jgi:hypothetical protein
VTTDDNENRGRSLPPQVERALAEARVAAGRSGRRPPPSGTRSARWLALVPVTAGLLMMLLMMPRAAPPDELPLPRIDMKAFDAVRKDDIERAASARTTRLASDVLLVGTTLRTLNKALATNASDEDVSIARTALDHAFRSLIGDGDRAFEGLRSLRAVQLESFLAEVRTFEATGKITDELDELAGGFIDRMHAAGWLQGNAIVLDENELRAAYKLVWSAQVGGERMPPLALTLDEQRVLYSFYLTHPHAPEAQRASYEAQRRAAASFIDCQQAIAQEKLAIEQWRLEKVRRLGEIDPTYPTGYAMGVAYYRVGRYDTSLEAFRSWIEKHPDGPLSLRARNHMKAAMAAYGPS